MPVAMHNTKLFRSLVTTELAASNMPNVACWETPHPLVVPDEQLSQYARAAIDDIVLGLTQLSVSAAVPPQTAKTSTLEFSGSSWANAEEDFNRAFHERRWGDGLPLVPPTREKVDWMLTGTDRKPSDPVVVTRPSGRIATIESVAINAVMAGAMPAYLPVIIGALDAMDKIPFGWGSVTTTAGCSFVFVVGGSVAKQLDVNSRSGALGYGWRANSTIGRAVALTIRTVGGTVPGLTDMHTLSYTHTIVMPTFAENTDVLNQIGWPTFNEERGFGREDNTVSAGIVWTIWYLGVHGSTSPRQIVTRMLECTGLNSGTWGGAEGQAGTVILPPELARMMAKEWPNKNDFKQYWLNQLREKEHKYTIEEAKEKVDLIEQMWYPTLSEEQKGFYRTHPVRIFSGDPKFWNFLVAGGAGRSSLYLPDWMFSSATQDLWSTRKLDLPANWDRVLKNDTIKPHPMPAC